MKSMRYSVLITCLVCLLCCFAKADYVNVADFTISGSYAGTAGSPMPWNTSLWNLGSNGGYWGSTDALTQYTGVTVPTVTLTYTLENGTYDFELAQVCTANTPSTQFGLFIEGNYSIVSADDPVTWVRDYYVGRYEVTDGELTIVVPSAAAGAAQWVGFTGFNVNAVPEPAAMGLLALGTIGFIRRRKKS